MGDKFDLSDEYESVIQRKLSSVKENDCKNIERVEQIIRKNMDAFALKFDECKISELNPMDPDLKEGVEACTAKPRRMS